MRRTHRCASARDRAQYWFFLRKVVCKPYGFHTFLPYRPSASTGAPSLAPLSPAMRSLRSSGVLMKLGTIVGIEGKMRSTAGHLRFSNRRAFKRLASPACQGRCLQRFASKMAGGHPCTRAYHNTLAYAFRPRSKGMPPGEGVAQLIYRAVPAGKKLPARLQVGQIVRLESTLWVEQPGVT